MPEPALTDSLLVEIESRDEEAAGGHVTYDSFMATDRHVLLKEVKRQRDLITRLRKGQPAALREVTA